MDYSQTLNKIIEDVKNHMKLHPKRHLHIEGVATCLTAFSRAYQLDETKLKMIAYLHDITKKFDFEFHIKNSFEIHQQIFLDYPCYYHAASAFYLAKEKYHIEDLSILNAILYHCTGHDEIDIYGKLLIIADVSEPSRDYKDSEYIYHLAFHDIEQAYQIALNIKYKSHLQETKKIHPWFKKAIEKLEEKHAIKN